MSEWLELNAGPVWTEVRGTDTALRLVDTALTGYWRKAQDGVREYRSVFDGERFLSGLLEWVLLWVKPYALEVSVQRAEREELPFDVEVDPEVLKPFTGQVLREYQCLAVREMLRNERGIVTLPTGGGKTTCAAAFLKLVPEPCLYLVGQQNLADQTVAAFRKCGISAGVYYGGCTYPEAQVVVAVVNSAAQLIRNVRMTAEKMRMMAAQVLICDEVHHASASMYRTVGALLPAPRRYGLTATPFDNLREPTYADLSLIGLIGPELINIPTRELVEAGYLAEAVVVFLRPAKTRPVACANSTNWHEIYPAGVVNNVERNLAIAEVTAALFAHNERILLLVAQVEHGINLLTLLHSKGVPAMLSKGSSQCLWYDGEQVRTKSLAGYEAATKFNTATGADRFVLLGTTLYDEGVDIPMASALIRAGAMKKSRKTKQRTGRVLRPMSGNRVWVVDFLDDGTHFVLGHQSSARYATDRAEGHTVHVGPEVLEEAGIKISPGVFFPGAVCGMMRISSTGAIHPLRTNFEWAVNSQKGSRT